MWFLRMSIHNGFILLLLQKLSLNLFTTKKVSVLLFRSYYARIIFMICCDASCLVSDNLLQTNEKQLLQLLQKALWQLLQSVLISASNFLTHSMKWKILSFFLSFGWDATTKVIVTVMIHGGLWFNQQRTSISISGSISDHVYCVYSCIVCVLSK